MPLSPSRHAPRTRFRRSLAIGALLLAAARPAAHGGELTLDTLDSLLHEAVQAFSAGDYSAAAERFTRAEEEFGHETVFEEGGFLRRILPLAGYAELRSGSPARAADAFERYLERFDRDRRPNAFVLYHLALAHRGQGDPDAALERFRHYIEVYPDRREAALATLQKAEILFETDRSDDALALLHRFSESDAPARFRTQGRLLAVRRAIDDGNTDLAKILLLDTEWEVDAMPEVAVLTFAAMNLGDHLMATEDYEGAIRSYRLALPRNQLIELQKERIDALRNRAPQVARPDGAAGPIRGARLDFYRNLHDRMQRQLASLEESGDYTPGLTLRRGQAFLLSGRHRSAWLIFESLALDETLELEIRRDAHYRWILAANGLEEWEEALTIARNFTRRYEESELAPQAFYLIADAHSEQRRYPEAIEVLTDLIERFPGHDLSQQWHFTRGYSHALLDRFGEAREDFASARDTFPEAHLTAGADFWYALTYLFEQDYATALDEFDRLAATYPEHRLTGEILHRRASTLYAQGDLDSALAAARDFTEKHPNHPRFGEALVLKGEILAATGEPEAAIAAFGRVPPESDGLFEYAVFKTGDIYRAHGKHEQIVSHFRSHLQHDDLTPSARVSEALYRIGRAYTELDRMEEAVPLFLETLDLYGNDRNARGIHSILTTLEDLHSRLRAGTGSTEREPIEGARTLIATNNFRHWLEAERERAERNARLTWHSRLTLELSDRERSAGRPHRADSLLLELAGRDTDDELDARCLGRAGHFLREHGLAAGERFLRQLLETFPSAPERAYAHYGLARIAYQDGNYDDAVRRLRRFQSETPGHHLSIPSNLMKAEILRAQGNHTGALATYEAVLEQRAARGRPHAEALRGLAKVYLGRDEPEKAIASFQRIYTLYRAYDDLVAEAYLESARLFETIGKPAYAHNTLVEMRETSGVEDPAALKKAARHEARLREQLPDAAEEEETDL